ncbi:MAG: GntR family transcriptional regulator, partial [Propionibacteriaceae bacterium]|nr:GntR family transcriptional regulator [Propionibacteriaceae bacterium]
MTESPDSAGRGLHADVLQQLGSAITSRRLAPGTIVTLEDLEATYGASRSVVREVVRVLESDGLVALRRRVGVVVLPPGNWNLFDSQIIRWRLASTGRLDQLRALMEVRVAVEPEAARLAALRSRRVDAGALMGLAGRLWVAGEQDDLAEFLELDIQFHQVVLASSGNDM